MEEKRKKMLYGIGQFVLAIALGIITEYLFINAKVFMESPWFVIVSGAVFFFAVWYLIIYTTKLIAKRMARMNDKHKAWAEEVGHTLLAAFLGDGTAYAFIGGADFRIGGWLLYLKIATAIVLWYIYIDFLKWVAKKVPDEKRKEKTEVRDPADH